jgi:hypothetical protein
MTVQGFFDERAGVRLQLDGPRAVAHDEMYRKLIDGCMARQVLPGLQDPAQVRAWRNADIGGNGSAGPRRPRISARLVDRAGPPGPRTPGAARVARPRSLLT